MTKLDNRKQALIHHPLSQTLLGSTPTASEGCGYEGGCGNRKNRCEQKSG